MADRDGKRESKESVLSAHFDAAAADDEAWSRLVWKKSAYIGLLDSTRYCFYEGRSTKLMLNLWYPTLQMSASIVKKISIIRKH